MKRSDDTSMTLYKMIVLYLLSRVQHPLTQAQISDFILEKDYTTYLNLQTVFSQLSQAGLIEQKKVRNRTFLSLTADGASTLEMFAGELTAEIKQDVDQFLRQNAVELRDTVSVTADYHLSSEGGKGYLADLTIREQSQLLLSLSVSLPTEEIAGSVCRKWEENSGDIYALLMEKLL